MKAALGITLGGLFCLAASLPALPQSSAHSSTKQARIAHGEYLVKGVAGCADCHTPMNDRGEPLPGQWLKGSKLSFGSLAPFPAWAAVAPDIAGLNGWTTQNAIHFLMTGLKPDGQQARPPMPPYRMNRADATAVVAYLKSLP